MVRALLLLLLLILILLPVYHYYRRHHHHHHQYNYHSSACIDKHLMVQVVVIVKCSNAMCIWGEWESSEREKKEWENLKRLYGHKVYLQRTANIHAHTNTHWLCDWPKVMQIVNESIAGEANNKKNSIVNLVKFISIIIKCEQSSIELKYLCIFIDICCECECLCVCAYCECIPFFLLCFYAYIF